MNTLRHISFSTSIAPERFTYPFAYTPHPWAQQAAEEVMAEMRQYKLAHPESELHRQGKMFGVLVVEGGYLAAFSAKLDGCYHHPGFVPPVVDIQQPEGYFRREEAAISMMPMGAERKSRSQALQRWLFTQYKMLNGRGETKDLMTIFRHEKPILTEEEYFHQSSTSQWTGELQAALPPAAAGECCAPKLLQYAFSQGLKPLCMAEFWVGASPAGEVREEGCYYPACQSRCRPILGHMLQGLEVEPNPKQAATDHLLQQIRVVYEDEVLLVVNKPSGLLSAPGKDMTQANVQTWSGAWPCHRLDQDTSGLLVLAKNKEVLPLLQKQFLRRDIRKRYEAVLEHVPECGTQGVVRLPLLPNPLDRPRQMVHYEHGKPAVTRYEVGQVLPDGRCLVDFYPETGRTHQLRVHAAHRDGLHAPIVGDRLYGSLGLPGTPGTRLLLHAAELTFVHPITQQEMTFLVPNNFIN